MWISEKCNLFDLFNIPESGHHIPENEINTPLLFDLFVWIKGLLWATSCKSVITKRFCRFNYQPTLS